MDCESRQLNVLVAGVVGCSARHFGNHFGFSGSTNYSSNRQQEGAQIKGNSRYNASKAFIYS